MCRVRAPVCGETERADRGAARTTPLGRREAAEHARVERGVPSIYCRLEGVGSVLSHERLAGCCVGRRRARFTASGAGGVAASAWSAQRGRGGRLDEQVADGTAQ